MRKNTYKECLSTLQELHSKYPTYPLAQHISTAMADYGDFWGLTDREFLFALKKYSAELEMDAGNVVSEDYVQKIVADANSLFTPDDEEDEDGY